MIPDRKTTADDVGFEGFDAQLASIIAAPSSPEMEQRIEAERKATRTEKQRAKRATRTKQINFRVSEQEKALLDRMATELELSATDVVVMALEELAKRRKIGGLP